MKKRDIIIFYTTVLAMICVAFWIGYSVGCETRRLQCERWHEDMVHENCSYCYYG